MTSQEMKNIRKRLGLERLAFARLIGLTGTDRNSENRVRQYESGGNDRKQIPLYIARLVWLILRHHDRNRELPVFPEWDGYDYDHTPDPEHQKVTDGSFY